MQHQNSIYNLAALLDSSTVKKVYPFYMLVYCIMTSCTLIHRSQHFQRQHVSRIWSRSQCNPAS